MQRPAQWAGCRVGWGGRVLGTSSSGASSRKRGIAAEPAYATRVGGGGGVVRGGGMGHADGTRDHACSQLDDGAFRLACGARAGLQVSWEDLRIRMVVAM